MKKIDLGNNVKVEVIEEGFKITSASGNEILLDCNGEFLSYTNKIALRQATERKEFFKKFVMIDRRKKDFINCWGDEYSEEMNEMKQNFFYNLGIAMAEVEYEYYIAEISDSDELINMMNRYQHILPEYKITEATNYEIILWIAYNIAKGYWTFEEGLLYNRRRNKILYVLKK